MESRAVATASWINVAVSLIICLLSLAPFTPALTLFAITIPAAALTARRGHATASVLNVALWLLAVALGPVPASQLLSWPSVIWFLGTSACAAYVVLECVRRWRQAANQHQIE